MPATAFEVAELVGAFDQIGQDRVAFGTKIAGLSTDHSFFCSTVNSLILFNPLPYLVAVSTCSGIKSLNCTPLSNSECPAEITMVLNLGLNVVSLK